MANQSFLGTGWGFPPVFDKNTKSVSLVSDEADIRDAIFLIMSTRTGERVMRREFGSDLRKMMFETLSTTHKAYMKSLVEEGLRLYEPRINVESVTVEQPDPGLGRVDIHIDYRIRATNTRDNLVYPFYLSETANL